MLFESTGLPYTIAANVPDPPITMKVQETPFEEALRAMLRLANSSGVPVTYRTAGELYEIGLRRPDPFPQPTAGGFPPPRAGEVQVAKIPINFLRPSEAVTYLTQQPPPPGILSIQPIARDNALIVRGSPDAIEDLRRLVELVDVRSTPLSVSVSISGPGVNGTPLAIRSSARALIGDDVTIAEEAAPGGQPAHLKVTLKTQLLGNGDLQVASDWDVSVPIAAGARGPVRLVKRLSTTTQLHPGEQVPVAEVDLSGWGGKGALRLWISGEWGGETKAVRNAR